MQAPIRNPVNRAQREFNALCENGGGVRGGPARGKVLDLLRDSGRKLNEFAIEEMDENLSSFPDANPWHICFAVGLSWGHLAKLDVGFTESVLNVLSDWNDDDLRGAKSYCMERGPDPIEQSLRGAYSLFGKVILPEKLPSTLEQLSRAQERWLSPILNPISRPPYIGAWNGTAMFMAALFAQPELAATQKTPPPMLPPGGPVHVGLSVLYQTGIISRSSAGSLLDDEAFEPGAIYENNEIMGDLCEQLSGWCMIDVHSALYMLGTRDVNSENFL